MISDSFSAIFYSYFELKLSHYQNLRLTDEVYSALKCRACGIKAPAGVKDCAKAEPRREPGAAGYRRINRALPYLSLNSRAGFQQ